MKRLTIDEIYHKIDEELSRSDIRAMINSSIEDFLKEREFEKRIKEIVADVFETYFKNMYTKRGFWKNSLMR